MYNFLKSLEVYLATTPFCKFYFHACDIVQIYTCTYYMYVLHVVLLWHVCYVDQVSPWVHPRDRNRRVKLASQIRHRRIVRTCTTVFRLCGIRWRFINYSSRRSARSRNIIQSGRNSQIPSLHVYMVLRAGAKRKRNTFLFLKNQLGMRDPGGRSWSNRNGFETRYWIYR